MALASLPAKERTCKVVRPACRRAARADPADHGCSAGAQAPGRALAIRRDWPGADRGYFAGLTNETQRSSAAVLTGWRVTDHMHGTWWPSYKNGPAPLAASACASRIVVRV